MSESTKKTLTAYHQPELEVIRITNPDGTISYNRPQGGGLETNSCCSFDFFGLVFSRMQSVLNMLSEDYSAVEDILGPIVRNAEQQVDEALSLIYSQIGTIRIVSISHGNPHYRSNRVIDTQFIPVDGKNN